MNKHLMRAGALLGTTAAIAAVVCGAVTACAPSETDTLYVPVAVTGSGVVDGDGNELVSGNTYAMPTSVVYTATTEESQTASEGITLEVVVEPDVAADKRVTYTFDWTNGASSWATGKAVTDYVKLTPTAEGSTVSTLKCLQPFGEQITVTAASVQNPEITATCTVDYAKRVTGVNVKIGALELFNDDKNLFVDFVIGNTGGAGGLVKSSYQTSSVYSLDDDFSNFRVIANNPQWRTKSMLSSNVTIMYEPFISSGDHGEELYFDKRLFNAIPYRYTSGAIGTEYLLKNLNNEKLLELFEDTDFGLSDGTMLKFFDVTVTVKGAYSTYEDTRSVWCMSYSTPVSGLSFKEPTVIV